MNKVWSRNIIRFVFLLVVQLVLLKRVNLTFGDFNYIHLTIYTLFVALIPLSIPRTLLIVIAFTTGLCVDFFYDSIGVHAAALTFVSFVRKYILRIIEPIDGYKKDSLTPYVYGLTWFVTYMGIFLFLNLFMLYTVEAFSLVYIKEIVLRTAFSFIPSLFVIIIGMLIFNPKY